MKRILITVLVALAASVTAVIATEKADAHLSGCHVRHTCPSDNHTYAFEGKVCTSHSYQRTARDTITLVFETRTYWCYLAGTAPKPPVVAPGSAASKVASIYDGDTITMGDGDKIRLLQIDTPELRGSECFGRAAKEGLLKMIPIGSTVRLVTDPKLDTIDHYGRHLRYIMVGTKNINVEMVRAGFATPYFYQGDRGAYAAQLLVAVNQARAAKRGLWGACNVSGYNPEKAITTLPR